MNNEKWIELVGDNFETINKLIKSYITKNIKEQNLKEKLYVYITATGCIKSDNKKILNNDYELVYSCTSLQKFEYVEGYQFQCFNIEDYCDYEKMIAWSESEEELNFYESDWDMLKEYDPTTYNKLVKEEMQILIDKAIKQEGSSWYDNFVEKFLCDEVI